MMDPAVSADGRGMVVFPIEVWSILGLIAFAAVLAILGAAAHARREECRLHDLKIRVHDLRAAYQRRLAELRRGNEAPEFEAEIVDETETLRRAA